MSGFNSFIDGMMSGLGMWLMMTVLGVLSFLALKKQFTKMIAKLWKDIKKEALKLDGTTVDVKIKTKNKK
jgi:Na+-translocating ferredoxin:NAD+ oxidoreductase RnfE subunit